MPITMIELHNDDSIRFLQGQKSDTFDLVVADPPYSSGGMTRSDRSMTTKGKYLSGDSGNIPKLLDFEGDNRDQRSYLAWSYLWMSEAMRCMKDGAVIVVFTDWRQLPITTDAVQAAGFVWRGIVPWYKQASRPMADRFTSSCEYAIWCTKGVRSVDMGDKEAKYPEGFYQYRPPSNRIHVTEKPVELYRHIYQVCRDGAHILDPFLGSGNSAIAAHQEGRGLCYTGVEINAEVYGVAKERVIPTISQLRIPD